MPTSGNAAQNIGVADTSNVDEPSMDEILASIREIIAEDENADDALKERAQYTYPSDPSNANDVRADAQMGLPKSATLEIDPEDLQSSVSGDAAAIDPVSAAMIAAMETNLEAEVSTSVENSLPDTPVLGAAVAAHAEMLGESTFPPEVPDLNRPYDIHERAEQVRQELGLSTAAGNGLSLEQRLEKYRVRGRMRAAQNAEAVIATQNSETLKKAVQEAIVSAPVVPQTAPPSANDVAKALLDMQSNGLTKQMEAFMQPLIRQWLNENLPTLVERLVRNEIERVSQGRKG